MIKKAILFSLNSHGTQFRKDGTPYISHPIEVAIELARNGGNENLICAGLLHDTVEDAGITEEQLKSEFNCEIAHLVSVDSEDKSKSWEERKTVFLNLLGRPGDIDHKMLVCADKLSNLRSLSDELTKSGDKVWSRFKRGKDLQKWLAVETVRALAPLDDMPMYTELKQLTDEIFNGIKENDGNGNIGNP